MSPRTDPSGPGLWGRSRQSGTILAAAVRASLLWAAVCSTAACWRIGEPTADEAIVTWAAYPDTVLVAQPFSFELAGPVSPSTCGRLDTARVVLTGDEIVLSAERNRCRSISFTYTEPTIFFEYALETASLAHERGKGLPGSAAPHRRARGARLRRGTVGAGGPTSGQ